MNMDSIDVSKALSPSAGQEEFVRDRFWSKVRRTVGRVPFLDQVLAAYYAAMDPATPARVKALLFAALAYFIMPADLIPDFIVGLGFADDMTVLATVLQSLRPHIKDSHVAKARTALERETAKTG